MKKRLRKKLHRGEFQEFGFQISWRFTPALTPPEDDQFFDVLIEMVETAGLTFGGGGGGEEEGSGFFCRAKHGSASDKDRLSVEDWFSKSRANVSVKIGPLEDAWHNPQPQSETVYSTRPKTRHALMPPKPKELDRT